MKSNDVKYSCFFAIGIFLIILVWKGNLDGNVVWSSTTSAVSVTLACRYVFLKWAWKWFPLLEKLHKVPNIEGKWTGKFVSTWRATPESPYATGPIDVTITQPDLYSLKVAQRSGESTSHSYGESFEILPDGTIMVNFSYKNDPHATVRDRSQISYGTARYELNVKAGEKTLSGNYFTDRKSTGSISLTFTPAV